jgi:hypothetical protein
MVKIAGSASTESRQAVSGSGRARLDMMVGTEETAELSISL